MTSEDQELLARISQLAGQINRHKNQQAGVAPVTSTPQTSSYRPSPPTTRPYGGRGGFHPRGGGYRVGKPAAYRNRTLVLNGASKTESDGGGSASASGTTTPLANGPPSATSWVSKHDRHRQLINSSVYEKEAQARTKAIEQTRLQKQKQRDAHERTKLRNHMAFLANSTTAPPHGSANHPTAYTVNVQGIAFTIAKNGSKLVKLPGDPNPPSSTPKTAVVGGVKFYRSKNGNMYRHAVVKAHRRAGTVKKVNQPCKVFSTTGSCAKGPLCRYIHDPAKVAVCKEFLQKGHCAQGDNCDLSHELTPERTPFCLHFAKGNCTNPQCPYTHSQVSSAAPVCRPFGIYGYCDQGADCPDRHVFECPDFSNTGVCKTKGCKLPHRERASFMRRAQHHTAAEGDADADEDLVDASSDESVSSDDVDSDEVDEFVGPDGDDADLDFVTQKDFIEL